MVSKKKSRLSKQKSKSSPKHIIDVIEPSQMKKYLKMRNKKQKPLLVWYHAKGCGHCTAMSDEWNKFVKNRENNSSLNIAKIENQFIPNEERDQEQIYGYPTIKLFLNGKSNEFDLNRYEGRTETAFNSFIDNNLNVQSGGGLRNKKRSNRRNKKTNKRTNKKTNKRTNKRSNKRSNRRQRGGKGMLDHIEDKMQVLENMLGNYSYDK
jgi:thiol-disulfide isomerase/thioredoxin